jgi:hypothetical protein
MSETTVITVIKTKPIKSTTSVSGTLILCSNDEWYSILISRPSRNPWFIRGLPSNRNGKSDMNISAEIFSLRCKGSVEPEVEVGIEMLLQALNGEKVAHDKISY